MKKALAKIAISGTLTLMVIILIVAGIQFFSSFQAGEPSMDMMTAQSSSPSTVKGSITSSPSLSPWCETSAPSNVAPAPSPSYSGNTIGLSTGGAKDIASFRENIRNDYLPLPTDVTYEGLFYDYYFDTGINRPCNKLFCPSYAVAVTRDPLSRQTEYYISVGLNSGLRESDFERKQLNLVIVLDVSGSMGAYYNQYYYDNYGKRIDAYAEEGVSRRTKLDSAQDAVLTILDKLDGADRFAIVLFDDDATLAKPMGLVSRADMYEIEKDILDLTPGSSTNLDAGMDMATAQFRGLADLDSYEYENRIIILTDAQPNTSDISSTGLMRNVERNADNGIYTTFIGIGVDFNSQLIESITKVRGANYYAVHSPREFRRRMEEEFDFMVTPLVFNLRLNFESRGWRIDQVIGSPEADAATGSLMTINTLFPSKSEGGETKGGLVLLKLRRLSSESDDRIYLRVSYEDRNGYRDTAESVVYLEGEQPEYFENTGIRKGILLSRYAALLKNWMIDERQHMQYSQPWDPCISETTGIVIPRENVSQWERRSLPLRVSEPYVRIFRDFSRYFTDEMEAIGDYNLEQELDVLETLLNN